MIIFILYAMMNFPTEIINYICELSIKDRSPAYLKVNAEGIISDWGGHTELYGMSQMNKDVSIGEISSILESFFPLTETESMVISCLQTDSGVSADIHIFPTDNQFWILILDARLKEAEQMQLQQKANELSLLRFKHSKILDQYLGKEITEKLLQLNIPETGENKYVSILFADICGFTPYSEKHSPTDVSKVLNIYLAHMIQPILDEGGIVDKIIGDAVMGIFGILPSAFTSSYQSLKAAFRMLEAIAFLKQEREHQGQDTFEISIGIATGNVFLGILGSKHRRTLTTIGHYVNLAARLESQARFNEILIDENTFRDAPDFQRQFRLMKIDIKGIHEPVMVYSYVHNYERM